MVMTEIYIVAEEYDRAIDELEYLFSIESPYTAHTLRLYPYLDPLRDHPRFQALIENYDTAN
jgi:hypothetical protein